MENYNYIEYLLYDGINDDGSINTNMNEDMFMQILKRLTNSNYKYFGKQHKTYYHHDLVYENYNQEEIKTYSRTIQEYKIDKDKKIVTLFINKDKIPFHMFPASTLMNAVSTVKKLVFRAHNRIYINFQLEKIDGQVNFTRKIYINYNHDENLDSAYISDILGKTIKELVG